MGGEAATAMRKVLVQVVNQATKTGTMRAVLAQVANQPDRVNDSNWEAALKLVSNRDRVVQDITNTGIQNIDGKALTQKDLKRVDSQDRAAVDAMIIEVCCRLLGRAVSQPSQAD